MRARTTEISIAIFVVISIAGLFAAIILSILTQSPEGRKKAVPLQIRNLQDSLEMYKLDNGRFPSTEEGLQALFTQPSGTPHWAGPYFKPKSVPLDPWKKPFTYRIPSTRPEQDYDLCSNGPEGSNAPICNDIYP